MTLLEVKDLHTSFFTSGGKVKAVRGIDLLVEKGKTLGLVGESGCGKSVTALSIMRLVPSPGRIVRGEIIYNGRRLLELDEQGMMAVRGKEISMVFQEPMTSLNPVFTIGDQIGEAIQLHQNLSKARLKDKIIETLRLVGIPSPETRIKDYPHQLSGGMRQRVVIAMALSCNPSLLIADEPTTALDVTIQAQILELIKDLQKRQALSMILITHDLGIVAEMVDEVAVMYAGKVVEHADIKDLFANPLHPYTLGLLASIPPLGGEERMPLRAIPGVVPNLLNLPDGCSFYDRCHKADVICTEHEPELMEVKKGHWVACYKSS
ncbi:MAG: ABC transporter ATP-binding protein [Deltaproteobacteria bacterium]|nr:ABC transporter ATP-binding protein [Deltaproteobacteria bacterium]